MLWSYLAHTRRSTMIVLLLFWVNASLRGRCDEPTGIDRPEQAAPAARRSLADAVSEQEQRQIPEFVDPTDVVRKTLAPPPEATRLSPQHVWIDSKRKRVYVDGYVTMREGPLEMFACPTGTKEHESVVATLAKSSEVHAALLAIGAQQGTPVTFLPRFVPATGQRIRVWVCYWDQEGKFQSIDARQWIRRAGTDREMADDWVFSGSSFWKDPSDGSEYYQADGGDMICVSNFSTAMMDLPIDSSAENQDLMFIPFTDRVPQRGTPVRLVLVPIPIPADQPLKIPQADAETPPTKEVLPVQKPSAETEQP